MPSEEEPRIPPWLAGIDPGQVEQLITTDADVIRVQAGPGTGKTFGLTRRVLRLLHPDGYGLDPDAVLVCAFNRAIAKDLEREIAAQLEPYGLPLPNIRTVHSLCATIARDEARFLLQHEVEAMLFDVRLANATIRGAFTQRQAIRALREHEAGLVEHPALATAVREWLADHNGGLVGDVPRRAERALDQGQLFGTSYRHVIVDEFQDLTPTEAKVVTSIGAEDRNLVAVGDRKQSIYAFRGNDNRGLDRLQDLVDEPVTDLPMNECRRCPTEVVGLANAVMALEGDPLVDRRGPGGQVHVVHFNSPDAEIAAMAREIARVYQARPEAKHLVMVTRRKWGYELKAAIRAADAGVPVETLYSEDVLETWPTREAFIFLSVLANPNDAVTLRDWVGYQEDDNGKRFKAASRNAEAYLDLKGRVGALTVQKLRDLGAGIDAVHGTGRGRLITRVRRLLDLLDAFDADRPAEEVYCDVLDPDRWIDYAGDDADLARDDLERLAAECDRLLADHPDLPNLVKTLRYRIATREPLGEPLVGGVRIVTLWGAKGLTADHVYVVGICDEALPGPNDPDASGLQPAEHLAEQRRLLFVSLTRARQTLVLSRATRLSRGKVASLGLLRTNSGSQYNQDLTPCRFFGDVPAAVIPTSVRGATWGGVRL